jgi:hypothetical protein
VGQFEGRISIFERRKKSQRSMQRRMQYGVRRQSEAATALLE